MEKIVETKTCTHCTTSFDITDRDIAFYEKISPSFWWKKYNVPTPNLCPNCREQRRLSAMNQRKLYKSTCWLCKSETVSRFSPEADVHMYCNKCWSSDSWDALDYGLDYDESKSFFEQIETLIKTTPFQNLIGSYSNIENNAIYTNYTADIHNSYMVSESDFVSDCMYGSQLRKSTHLLDCHNSSASEYAYQSLDSDNLFSCFYATDSSSSSHCHYIKDCHGCSFCIWCVWLKNKQYHIYNKEVTKDEFNSFLKDNTFQEIEKNFKQLVATKHAPSKHIIWSEKCTGDYIYGSHNAQNSYDILSCNDVKYCTDVNHSEDLMDISSYGSHSNHMYEWLSVGRYSRNILFCNTIGKWEDLLYCIDVKKSKDCFWCVNLKWARYCILNKQYTKEQYETLVPKIIEKMKQDSEWWEFFPSSLSPFGYHETIANEYFPLSKDEALKKWFNWSDYEAPFPKVEKIIPADKLPEDITEIPDDILAWAIECEVTKKPFRIIKPELEFYRKHSLPIPKRHPNQRHLDRMNLRNPRD